jgi:tetratricopeptide (TPR) repeat protein
MTLQPGRSAGLASGDGPRSPRRRAGWVAVLPALAALAAFAPAVRNGWVDWDDEYNFLGNTAFRGVGWPQIHWAWTTYHLGVYQPLGWMSIEAQYAAWGMDPRGYHAVSLLMHMANASLLYVLALRLVVIAGRGGRADAPPDHVRIGCAVAAALWAAHPLRAEAVAWISCQTYLSGALFALLSVLAYVQAAGSAGVPTRRGRLFGSWLLMGAALLCKAVPIGVVASLVILDVYPLRRLGGTNGWSGPSARRVWREKVPFFALAAGFAVLAVRAKWEEHGPLLANDARLPSRIARAGYGAWFYLAKTLWPRDLAVIYRPHDQASLAEPRYAVALLLVLGISLAAWLARGRIPSLLAAWLAYLVILAPNSGIVWYTQLLPADRYSYVSTMPLAILLGGALARMLTPGRRARPLAVAATATGLVLVGWLIVLGWCQSLTWYDSESLWRHAIAHGAAHSDVAHNILGSALARKGRVAEAMGHYAEAIRLNPGHFRAHFSLGTHLAQRGRLDEAIGQFREVIRLVPTSWEGHYNLGLALARTGRNAEAADAFARAAGLRPDSAEAHANWGAALARQGRYAEAMPHYRDALRLRPDLPEARRNLAEAERKAEPVGASD